MPSAPSGRYEWFGWTVSAASGVDIGLARLTETHEHFHRHLDDTTAFGGLVTTIAALAEAQPDQRWRRVHGQLVTQTDLLNETFAVGASLLTTQRGLKIIDGYPLYDRYVTILERLLGSVHPWVALAGLRAAAMACMQSSALELASVTGFGDFEPTQIPPLERPNHRLSALVQSHFDQEVAKAERVLERDHGAEPWWQRTAQVALPAESMEGEAGALSETLQDRLFVCAADFLRARGAQVLGHDAHHEQLRALLAAASSQASRGFGR